MTFPLNGPSRRLGAQSCDAFGHCDPPAGDIIATGRAGDRLGASVSAWDLDTDGRAEVIVGVPGADVTVAGRSVGNAGVAHILFSSGTQRALVQGLDGLQGTAEDDDQFGSALY